MGSRRGRRAGGSVLAVLAAAGIAVAGVVLAEERGGPASERSPVASGAPATSTDADADSTSDGTAVFARTGTDLPGSAALDRCRSDGRSVVDRYDTAALGSVVLQCGTASQGYEHIRIRHTGDWSDELAGATTDRDWDDLMLTAVRTALTTPTAGLPVDAGDGKVCYAAPLRFDDGSTPPEPWAKVIVSATTDRVITAYPTDGQDC